MILPNTRNTDILLQESGKELLIYDLKINKAFVLNETSKIIYHACDGKTSFTDLKNKHRKLNDDVILLAISEFNRENLLDEKIESGMSRRKLLTRAAAAAMALPVLTVIIVPRSVHALSCLSGASPCDLNNPGQCCSSRCLINSGNPICDVACIPGGNACDLNLPGDCCSQVCLINGGNPICSTPCQPAGNSCNLNFPGQCCSGRCLINSGNPICDV